MARREITQFFDDLDNSPLSEKEVKVVEFAFKGTEYTIDLSSENAHNFAELLQPYIKAARKRSNSHTRSDNLSKAQRNKDIRAWAISQGMDIPARGRLSAEVIAKYDAAHA